MLVCFATMIVLVEKTATIRFERNDDHVDVDEMTDDLANVHRIPIGGCMEIFAREFGKQAGG